jgi:hypothetical protein
MTPPLIIKRVFRYYLQFRLDVIFNRCEPVGEGDFSKDPSLTLFIADSFLNVKIHWVLGTDVTFKFRLKLSGVPFVFLPILEIADIVIGAVGFKRI